MRYGFELQYTVVKQFPNSGNEFFGSRLGKGDRQYSIDGYALFNDQLEDNPAERVCLPRTRARFNNRSPFFDRKHWLTDSFLFLSIPVGRPDGV